MGNRALRSLLFTALLLTGRITFAESRISGTIKNAQNGSIDYYCMEPVIERNNYQRELPLIDGRFEVRIDNIDPVKITIVFDHEQLDFFLLPGDSVSFSCDAQDLKNSLQIKSSHYNDQVYLTGMSMIQSIQAKAMAPYEIKGVGWDGIPDAMPDSLNKEIARQLLAFTSGKGSRLQLSKALQQRFTDTTYQQAGELLEQFYFQKAMHSQGPQISESTIDSLLANIKIENQDLFLNEYYLKFLLWSDERAYSQYRRKNGITDESVKSWAIQRIPFQQEHYQSPKLRYLMQTYVLCRNNSRNPEIFMEGVAQINQTYPKGFYHDQLQKMVLASGKLKNGQPAPSFELEDINGKTVSLESLKGKVLYIDFWATWCIPCVQENKAARQIKPRYKGKDVVFVYIIRDNNKEAWKDAVNKQGVEGLHLFAGNSPVFSQYQAVGVPKYVLIGKDGNIVTADAPRPSHTEKISILIDEALKQQF